MTKENSQRKIDFILSNIDNYKKITRYAYQIRKYLVDWVLKQKLSESNMYKITSTLKPQSRSAIWQNYFIAKHKCKKIQATKDAGDFEKDSKNYEYKASGFNEDGHLHVVQIRLWQNCDYIIQSISDKKVITFLLSHNNMKEEVNLCKASSAHGTKATNKKKSNIERRFTVKQDTEDWERWVKKYLINEDILFKKH